MKRNSTVYYNLGYWLLLYIPLALTGFYVTYFSVFFRPKAAIIHIHFGLVVLWMAMVIAQPFLIKYKKLSLHRLLGRVSYVLVPLVLLSGYAMLRFGYSNFIHVFSVQQENGLPKFTRQEVLQLGADYILIAFMYIVWLALFYLLGIRNKRKMHPHARYMLAAALTLTGPTVDRIFFINFEISHIFGTIPAESVSFFLIDMVLLYLLYRDKKANRNLQPLLTCLCIYLAGQVFYFLAPGTNWWTAVSNIIMQPSL